MKDVKEALKSKNYIAGMHSEMYKEEFRFWQWLARLFWTVLPLLEFPQIACYSSNQGSFLLPSVQNRYVHLLKMWS